MTHQKLKHLEFLAAQTDGGGTAAQLEGGAVQGDVPSGEQVGGVLRAPAGQSPHPGRKLAGVKGLGEIVVRTAVQSGDPVGHLTFRGK